jgi:hypothetical protein
MDSSSIEGFSTWNEWGSRVAIQVPAKPGVYIFRLAPSQRIRRLKGFSDLVYMGATKKGKRTLRDRLEDHLRPRVDMRDLGYQLERVIKEVGPLQVAWKPLDEHFDARWLERRLLTQYQDDHLEFPPLNRQETGKRVNAAERLLAGSDRVGLLTEWKKLMKEKAGKKQADPGGIGDETWNSRRARPRLATQEGRKTKPMACCGSTIGSGSRRIGRDSTCAGSTSRGPPSSRGPSDCVCRYRFRPRLGRAEEGVRSA